MHFRKKLLACFSICMAANAAPLFCQINSQSPQGKGLPEESDTSPLQRSINAALKASEGITVPLPEKTPFDNDQKLRAIYLRHFTFGYRIAYGGFNMTWCVASSPTKNAEVAGHYDGMKAAEIDLKKDPKKSPTKRSS